MPGTRKQKRNREWKMRLEVACAGLRHTGCDFGVPDGPFMFGLDSLSGLISLMLLPWARRAKRRQQRDMQQSKGRA